jgi:exonuclease III
MKIMFWNIRGLGGAGRRGQFKDLMSQHHLEVICLQETIKKNFTDHMLKDLVNGQDFS